MELHEKDLILLNHVQSFFFSAGNIRIRSKNGNGIFSVQGIDLQVSLQLKDVFLLIFLHP